MGAKAKRRHRAFQLRLREYQVALVLLVLLTAGYLLSHVFLHVNKDWSDFIQHTLLTLMVVLIVHILDHMYLSRGSLRMIQREFRPVSDAAKGSLERLAAASASLAAMRASGITRVYSSRFQASADMAREISAPDVTRIRLIGISLNDFILDNSKPLNRAYQMIVDRLNKIASTHHRDDRLDVKVLIIDPYSYGAQQRHMAETHEVHAPPGRLPHDVRTAADRLLKLKSELAKKAQKAGHAARVAFDCRLYRVAPQLFLIWTDRACYVEQYYFWFSRDAQSTVPVLRFETMEQEEAPPNSPFELDGRKNIHLEMERHFDWIWEHASVSIEAFVRKPVIGCDMGLCQATAVNVFMDQAKSAERIIRLLESVRQDSKVDLMGISLRSFFDEKHPIAQAFRANVLDKEGPTARILYIDPECRLARVRSYREALLANDGLDFEKYDRESALHGESALHHDAELTRRRLETLTADAAAEHPGEVVLSSDGDRRHRAARCKLRGWEYECAHACFMLRVDDVVLFEPYTYGKLDYSRRIPTLGGDMPVFEFRRTAPSYLEIFEKVPNRNPWGLLMDHFEFVVKVSKLTYSTPGTLPREDPVDQAPDIPLPNGCPGRRDGDRFDASSTTTDPQSSSPTSPSAP